MGTMEGGPIGLHRPLHRSLRKEGAVLLNAESLKRKAAEMVAQGHDLSKISQELGIDYKTLWAWSVFPDFKLQVEFHKAEIAASVAKIDREAQAKAREVLRHLLDDPDPQVRLNAAKALRFVK